MSQEDTQRKMTEEGVMEGHAIRLPDHRLPKWVVLGESDGVALVDGIVSDTKAKF